MSIEKGLSPEKEKENSYEVIKTRFSAVIEKLEKEGLEKDAQIISEAQARIEASQELLKGELKDTPEESSSEKTKESWGDKAIKLGYIVGRTVFISGKRGEEDGGWRVSKYGPFTEGLDSADVKSIENGDRSGQGINTVQEWYKDIDANVKGENSPPQELSMEHVSNVLTPEGEKIILQELGVFDMPENEEVLGHLGELWEDENAELEQGERNMKMATNLLGVNIFRKDRTLGMSERERILFLSFDYKNLDELKKQSQA